METLLDDIDFKRFGKSDFVQDVLLYKLLKSRSRKQKRFRALQYGKFVLQDLSKEECLKMFRFEKQDITRLAKALHIPARIRVQGRFCVSSEEGLCIALRRLAYPNRLFDLERLFGFSTPALSIIANTVIEIICNNKKHLLLDLKNNKWFNKDKLKYYAKAVTDKGSPLSNVWGFIDGTTRPIARPGICQVDYFSGHKRTHCVKYQAVSCPDGIIISLHGAYPGRRHDAGIFADSNLHSQLEECVTFQDEKFVIYGDPAYPITELIIKPHSTRNITCEEESFNYVMSAVRQCVEWGFGKIISLFGFVDFKKNQKLLLQDIECMYFAAVILTNCHTCLYKSQTSRYFQIEPPTLEEYLQ